MADEPENHTLHLLREMREETNRRFDEMREETNRHFDEMREEQAAFRAETRVSLAALSTDLKITKATVESIHETQRNHGTRLNAIEGRLAIIEKSAGLVEA